jgi:alkaline phosphatase D
MDRLPRNCASQQASGPRIGENALLLPRRTLLTGLGAAVAAPAFTAFGRSLPNIDTPFVLGVASGDPAEDGFTLWTRLGVLPLDPADAAAGLPGSVHVQWSVASDEGMRSVVRRGTATAERRGGHSIHVDVEGLAPDRPYWYRFTALGARSEIGRTRTLPARGAALDRLRIGIASCASYERGFFSAYRHLAEERPDLVLFLGDYIYEYSLAANADPVRGYGSDTATDVAGYRHRYARHRSDPDLQAAHAAAPWVSVWDDHEVQDDYSGIWSSHPELAVRDFRRRRAAGYRAWFENMPVRRALRPHGDHARIYRRFRYGDLATISTLDGRQYRSRQPCPTAAPFGKGHIEPASCADLADPSRTMLGAAQERWAYKGMEDKSAAWTLIAQDLLMATVRAGDDQTERYWTDTWDGFQAPRQRFLDAIAARRPNNPVILSGDYHAYYLNDLHQRPDDANSPRIATEILGTSITSNGPSYDAVTARLPRNPHIRFFDSRARGYVMLDLKRERMDIALRTISDRRDRAATVSTLANFAIESGRPEIVRA